MGRVILILMLLSFYQAEADEKGIEITQKLGTTYLVSIGVNTYVSYKDFIDGKFDFHGSCEYCMQDAEAMISRFITDTTAYVTAQRLKLNLDIFSLEAFNHSGANANLKSLAKTFNIIAAKAQKNDLIVVYYSGVSHVSYTEGDTTKTENRFYLFKDLSTTGKTEYFTIANLKIWLDRIASQNTIIISDAGPTDGYRSDFLTNLTTIKSGWKGLDKKNRFFVFPESTGSDDPEHQRGYFSQALTLLPAPYSIADLCNPDQKRFIENQFYQGAIDLCYSGGVRKCSSRWWMPNVFGEHEFLKKFGSLFATENENNSRGGDVEEIEAEPVKPDPNRKPKNRALLIGIDRYDYWDALKNPVFDAQTLGQLLNRNFGFDTTILRNPTQEEIINAIKQLAAEDIGGPADQLFIFFAGHGYYDELSGSGFLVAADSKLAKMNPSCSSFVQHNYLINILNNLPCPHITLVLDACYSGSIQKDVKISEDDCFMDIPIKWNNLYDGISSVEFINRSMSCPTRRYLTSGGKDYKVPDGHKGKHSPFAQELIDILDAVNDKEGIVTFTEVNSKMQKTINPQPRFGRFGKDAETSEFLFLKKKTP